MRLAVFARLSGISRFVVAVAALLVAPALLGPFAAAQAQQRSLAFQGTTRDYILHVPKNMPPGPRPLVIALHGALQSAGIMQRYLDLDAVADREGFVVAYPKGINLIWNDGRASVAGFLPIIHARDDAGFVLAVRDQLVAEGLADPGRAYLMGFSNGGFLTAFIACRHADGFAAFATMMMTVPVGYAESCKPSRPVPILMMNGTYDPIVPMFGRPTPGARLMSARESAQLFARIDGCASPEVSEAPNALVFRFNSCAGGAAVAYYEIAGGHQPPAQSVDAGDALAALLLGPRRSGIDAPNEIWSFFKRYGTPGQPVPDAAAPGIAGTPAAGTRVAGRLAVAEPLPLRPAATGAGAARPGTARPAATLASVPLPMASPLRRKSASAE
ncbi:polyhydroxybutyrate depolymerase [Ancylobacter sp. 3268]|uniref:alpha/beta hydrolase family esterase n=1 Tax=Ancylobacter sp. 3268 TaxID=2817752 RepID=UPI002855DD9D|nr:PHB depolymerase family esterase [Ancylobacter sp. 3268]MDR6953898.1 polyhydroxybutyrate depolymerase [Ancylobacter sp. 3268]